MGVDHPLEVAASFLRSPFHSLMDNDIVEHEIKQAVAENADADSDEVGVVGDDRGIINKSDGRQAENNGKPVVLLQRMIVNRVMRFMPYPQESMHDILVREPGHKLPEEKGADDDQAADNDGEDIHAIVLTAEPLRR